MLYNNGQESDIIARGTHENCAERATFDRCDARGTMQATLNRNDNHCASGITFTSQDEQTI